MLDYSRLFKLLDDNGYNSYKIKITGVMGQATYQKLKNGEAGLNHITINRICKEFNCQPNDIMEYIPDEADEKKGA